MLCLKLETYSSSVKQYQEVDLDSESRATVSYSVVDFLNTNSPKSFKSTEVLIAGTPKSNRALKNIFRVDIIDVYKLVGSTINCRLEYNSIDILKGSGKLTVNAVKYDMTRGYWVYDCYLVASRYNWVSGLTDKNICDLELGTHVKNDQTIINSWDRFGRNGTIYDHEYINCTYVPVHYGSWIDDINDSDNLTIQAEDLFPSVYVYPIVKAIFEQNTEYEIESNFMESEFFKGLIIPFTSDSGVFTRSMRLAQTINATVGQDIVFNSSSASFYTISFPDRTFGSSEYWNGTKYKAKYSVTYRIVATIVYKDNQPGGSNMSFFVSQDGGGSSILSIEETDIPTSKGGGQYREKVLTVELCVTGSDDYSIYVGANSFVPHNMYINGNYTTVSIRPISVFNNDCKDGTVSNYLPCISCKEFLDGLTHMFNLIWETDSNDYVVYVEPDPKYYQKDIQVNWTSKINESRPVTQKFITKENIDDIRLTYEMDDEDFWLKVERDYSEGYTPYGYLFDFNEQESDKVKEIKNKIFSPSASFKDSSTKGTNPLPPEWVRMWSQLNESTDPSFKFNVRILYYGGLQDYEYLNGTNAIAGFSYNNVSYPYFPHAWFINGYDSSLPSLAFNSFNYENDIGLAEIYWSDYAQILKTGRTVQAEVFLNERDISNLAFSSYIYISNHMLGNGVYRLSSIREWDADEGRALVELVLVSNI